MASNEVAVYCGEELGLYGFGHGHPFATNRHRLFWNETRRRGLDRRVELWAPEMARRDELESFHTASYVERVLTLSESGSGYLDNGDTPAFAGVYEAAAFVVGTTVNAVSRLASGLSRRAFVPIAGLHHARRDNAAGFCVFNDCGVAIEILRSRFGIGRIAYVDIDAHHGDGVYYSFEDDPALSTLDIHEDGRFLYPGTGWLHEEGSGEAKGTKLNIPLPPGADDELFFAVWERALDHIDAAAPELIMLQCGADGLAGDPLTHLEYTRAVHRRVAVDLCRLADRHCSGRVLAMGGGGYDADNIATAWNDVLEVLVEAT